MAEPLDDWTQQQKKIWDTSASRFASTPFQAHLKIGDEIYARLMDESDKDLLSRMLKDVRFSSSYAGSYLLDVGCGTGRNAVWFAQHFKMKVDGFDLSPKMIELARYFTSELELPDITYQVSSFHDFSSGETRYNVILLSGVLTYITDVDSFVAKLMTFVRPGALVIVRDIIHNSHEVKHGNQILHPLPSLVEKFKMNGFELILNSLANTPRVSSYLYSRLPTTLQRFPPIKTIFYICIRTQKLFGPFLYRFQRLWSWSYNSVFNYQMRFLIFKGK